ncbi:iron-containing alcohol dehydrogenase [Paludisphaera sp.]|uniref:iron-containing alcohol dehydrogenase n=1 Tax=Paludisphaera sp. TaxID=2017432 RepID=UPI00301C70AE
MIGPVLTSLSSLAPPAGTTSLVVAPTRVRIGVGAVGDLPAELRALGVSRPMIVTGPDLVAIGLVDLVRGSLPGATLWDGGVGAEAEARYRDDGRDGLVAVGGGSVTAAAGAMRVALGGPPLAAIPTTSGPGVEMMGASASLVVVDPTLARSLPADLTAATGLDALGHCIESFLATGFQPFADAAAVEGMRYIFRGLEAAIQNGGDLDARSAMATGALLGGTAANKGLGVAHALARAAEPDARGRHGTLAAVLLPHALRFNRQACEPRMADLASRVGLGRAGDGPGHLITLVELLRANAPLPRKLRDVPGLAHERLAEYARVASLDPTLAANPRPCAPALLEEVLDRAW